MLDSPTGALTRYNEAKRQVAACVRIDEVKEYRNKAKALEAYAEQAQDPELMRHATEIQKRAERRAGELLREMADQGERRSPGGDQKSSSVEGTRSLADLNVTKKQSHEWQKLAGMPKTDFEVFVDNCATKAEKIILNKKDDHLQRNSGNDEFYTPAEYVEAAREVMGVIDLDPASCKLANTIVKATRFYDQKANGLLKPWSGKVWMNPPYLPKLLVEFTERLIHFVAEGDVTEAIVLLNNVTETGWFQKIASQAVMICFPEGRISHLEPPDLTPADRPVRGSVLLYFGGNKRGFKVRFKEFGLVVSV